MEIEGFDAIMSSLSLAKKLYDIDRFDIVEQYFSDTLDWDTYYENIVGVITFTFSDYNSTYDDVEALDTAVFEDPVISDYFVYAMEYGKLHKLPHEQNPYVLKAQAEVRNQFSISHCIDCKLLAYTKTKKTAKQSKLVVRSYMDCNCDSQERIAYRLILIYAWFKDGCDKFKALEAKAVDTGDSVKVIDVTYEAEEVKTA